MSLTFIICCLIFKQHMYVGVTFGYVTLISSNICMLVIYLFYVTQQPYACYCSPWHMLFKKSQNMHMCFLFWSAVRLNPCHHSDTASKFKFTVSQWDHTSSIFGYHDHVSTVPSQRDYDSQSTLNPRLHDNLVNRCGWRSLSHSSPLSETRHVSGCSLLKNISY